MTSISEEKEYTDKLEGGKEDRDLWYSYECFHHALTVGSGLVFDVRLDPRDTANMDTAKCPVCGAACSLRGKWEADWGGYGSRAADEPWLARTNELLRRIAIALEGGGKK
jgi:hypothetical protein